MKRIKKSLQIIGAALSALAISIPLANADFSDVPITHPNSDAILYAQENGIVQGYPDETFKPDKTINRAEFTKIIMETVFPGSSEGENCFPDVRTDWFAKYVCDAVDRVIINGYPDGTFKPGEQINFVEAAKIIVLAFNFEYDTDAEIWFKGYVDILANKNAIPTSINAFDKKITRGEMTEIIYRLKTNRRDLPSTNFQDIATGNSTGESAQRTKKTDTIFLKQGLTYFDVSYDGNENSQLQVVLLPESGDFSNFSEQGETSGLTAYLINQFGTFSTRKAAIIPSEGNYKLGVVASSSIDANWTINFSQPRPEEADAVSQFTGSGRAYSPVFAILEGEKTVNLTHNGSGIFIVSLIKTQGEEGALISLYNGEGSVNESFSAEFPVSGLYVLEVVADGDWTLSFE